MRNERDDYQWDHQIAMCASEAGDCRRGECMFRCSDTVQPHICRLAVRMGELGNLKSYIIYDNIVARSMPPFAHTSKQRTRNQGIQLFLISINS